eukprot:2449520-Rhodomonas_salina.1
MKRGSVPGKDLGVCVMSCRGRYGMSGTVIAYCDSNAVSCPERIRRIVAQMLWGIRRWHSVL